MNNFVSGNEQMMSYTHLLKDRHLGERCVLVCNGPSLNCMDLSFLNQEWTIGLNKIFLGFQKYHFYANYIVAVNEQVLKQSAEVYRELSSVKFLSNRCSELYQPDAFTHILDTNSPPYRFCKDITLGVEEGFTVTFAALQVCYYLGFQQIVIIGMDHDYIFSGEPNERKVLQDADPNHFSPDYFGYGQKWDNPDLIKSEEYYRIARTVFEGDGRSIVDATVNGKCDVFEKRDYKQFFSL